MATVESLRRRVSTLRGRSNKDWIPRTWSFILETDEELPKDVEATINAQIRPNDVVYIRYIAVGFTGTQREGNGWSWGCVSWHGGAAIIRQDGRLERLRRR